MPLPECSFPFRLSEKKLAGIYASLEEAFAARDYLYVARFGLDEPELRGCSLIMLGNRVGGERLLDQHGVKTGRAYFYRAVGAWQDREEDAMRRWLRDAKAAGGMEREIERFGRLAERKSFRALIHTENGEVPGRLQDLPGFEIMSTASLAAAYPMKMAAGAPAPPARPFMPDADLILIHDIKSPLPDSLDAQTPVIATVADHDAFYHLLDEPLRDVNWLALASSSEVVEVGRAFGKKYVLCNYFLLPDGFQAKGATKRFADKAARTTDLLFTGSLVYDFYRDKRQRIVPLAHALDPRFAVCFNEGHLPLDEYRRRLDGARFTIASMRNTNHIMGRTIEALCRGVINLVTGESAIPFIFSERFACFQTYADRTRTADVDSHLRRYDEILAEFLPQAPQFESELANLFPSARVQWSRRLRHLLFATHMDVSPAPVKKISVKTSAAAAWLKLAFERAAQPWPDREAIRSAIEEGIAHCPHSLPLHYAQALLVRSAGNYERADDLFRKIAEGDYREIANEPFPGLWDSLHGSYWVMDARIRAHCANDLEPLASELDVWCSYALSHRADIALRANVPAAAARFAKEAVDLLAPNDAAWRSYMLATYGLYLAGDATQGEEFLQCFVRAIELDGRILNDFAPMAIDILSRNGREKEAKSLTEKLSLFLSRVRIPAPYFYLYPEIPPLLVRYNLPHGALLK